MTTPLFRAGQKLTADLLNSIIVDRAEVPTNEDLLFVWNWEQETNIAAIQDKMIAVMPFNATILSVNMVSDDTSVAANDTDFWQFDFIKKGLDGTSTTVMATRTTQATGPNANGPIEKQKNWSFDGATWNTRTVNAGEVLALDIPIAGSTALVPPLNFTIRYQRLAS